MEAKPLAVRIRARALKEQLIKQRAMFSAQLAQLNSQCIELVGRIEPQKQFVSQLSEKSAAQPNEQP